MSADSVTAPMHLYLELTYDRNHVLDVVHARQVIEPPIAASAAAHHTDEDADRLWKDIDDLKACEDDFKQLASLDMRFHLNIARASENPIIPLILEPIHRLLPQIKSSVYASVDEAKESALIWHRKILDEIIARNAEGARLAMTEHLVIAEEHARRMLAVQGKA
jgi:GntR family transcriptional repressor for pyruvate dehydrogenase complex